MPFELGISIEATGNGPRQTEKAWKTLTSKSSSNFMYEQCMEKYFPLSTKIGENGRWSSAICSFLSFLECFLIRTESRIKLAYKIRCLCAVCQFECHFNQEFRWKQLGTAQGKWRRLGKHEPSNRLLILCTNSAWKSTSLYPQKWAKLVGRDLQSALFSIFLSVSYLGQRAE